MIWPHVARKSLREVVRQPIAAATVLGLPLVLMVVFGAALPDDSALPAIDDPALAAGAPGGVGSTAGGLLAPVKPILNATLPHASTTATSTRPPIVLPLPSTSTPTAPSSPGSSINNWTTTTPWWWQQVDWWTNPSRGRGR